MFFIMYKKRKDKNGYIFVCVNEKYFVIFTFRDGREICRVERRKSSSSCTRQQCSWKFDPERIKPTSHGMLLQAANAWKKFKKIPHSRLRNENKWFRSSLQALYRFV